MIRDWCLLCLLGVHDYVSCFWCGCTLGDWQEEDDPWTQHIITSPRCGHVLGTKASGARDTKLSKNLKDKQASNSQYLK